MKTVKITFPDSAGEPVTGLGTKIQTSDGTIVEGVARLVITAAPREVIRAEMDLLVISGPVVAIPLFRMRDPLTGEWKEIASVTFADGSRFEAADISVPQE